MNLMKFLEDVRYVTSNEWVDVVDALDHDADQEFLEGIFDIAGSGQLFEISCWYFRKLLTNAYEIIAEVWDVSLATNRFWCWSGSWSRTRNFYHCEIGAFVTSCAHGDTISPRPSPIPSCAAKQMQRSNTFPRPIRSHADRCSCLMR